MVKREIPDWEIGVMVGAAVVKMIKMISPPQISVGEVT